MNVLNSHRTWLRPTLIAMTVASILLTACASAPPIPPGAAEARGKLTQLQNNPDLATRAPAAVSDAELAVRAAERPQENSELAAHRVYMADRKVDIAVALAKTALLEERRAGLSQQRDQARLDARTQEADRNASRLATAKVALADEKLNLAEEKRNVDASRDEADAARMAAADSAAKSAQLQQQLNDLNARPTDRGMVLTLGDVLFTSGQADLKAGATANLNRLAAFLTNYPDRSVIIEGYTDSIGGSDYNVGLSQRRADSVKSFLTGQGIGVGRLTTAGKGASDPIAGNDSAAGRQQNRRVEVIISNPLTVSR